MMMLTLVIFTLGCGGDPIEETTTSYTTSAPTRLTILHTNDWQSHMLGWGPNTEYSPDGAKNDSTVGGISRLSTLVSSIRANSENPVVLYDAGDFMAGALFQLLATTHAAELTAMQEVGYDAITLGNHEFDWGPQTLGEMISLADSLGVDVPIIASNTVPDTEDAADDALETHFDSGRIVSTMVQTLDNGIKVGLFGVLGDDAADIAPGAAPTTFSPMVEAAAAAVATLKSSDVDLIVGITHAGVNDNTMTSEDHLLVNEVAGIDVIVGGHSHTALFEPIIAGDDDTIIVQAGAYTRYLGQLDLVLSDDGDWEVETYELHELDDSIQGDSTIDTMVDGYVDALNDGPLKELGFSFDEPLSNSSVDAFTDGCAESGLGNLITDSYRNTMNALDPTAGVEFAFESQGVIRDDLLYGDSGVTSFSDIFRVLPLGFGTDDVPGYALVSFWVTAEEILDTCEVSASLSPNYGCDYFIELSGLRCTIDMERSQFNRAQTVERQVGDKWELLDVEDEITLYRVAVDSYVASLMWILEDLTYGAIKLQPKDISGTPLKSPDEMLFDGDPSEDGVQEVKLWSALIYQLESFEDTNKDGLPDLPEGYGEAAGRIIGM